MDRRVTARRYVTETITPSKGSAAFEREARTRNTRNEKERPWLSTQRRHREESVSRAEGGRDYRSWAGKPRINRWRVALPSQWRVPAVDHPFPRFIIPMQPRWITPQWPRSAVAESGHASQRLSLSLSLYLPETNLSTGMGSLISFSVLSFLASHLAESVYRPRNDSRDPGEKSLL